jgi:hypothetical protein
VRGRKVSCADSESHCVERISTATICLWNGTLRTIDNATVPLIAGTAANGKIFIQIFCSKMLNQIKIANFSFVRLERVAATIVSTVSEPPTSQPPPPTDSTIETIVPILASTTVRVDSLESRAATDSADFVPIVEVFNETIGSTVEEPRVAELTVDRGPIVAVRVSPKSAPEWELLENLGDGETSTEEREDEIGSEVFDPLVPAVASEAANRRAFDSIVAAIKSERLLFLCE